MTSQVSQKVVLSEPRTLWRPGSVHIILIICCSFAKGQSVTTVRVVNTIRMVGACMIASSFRVHSRTCPNCASRGLVPHRSERLGVGRQIRRLAVPRDASSRPGNLGSLPSSRLGMAGAKRIGSGCIALGGGCVALGGGDYDGDLLMFTSDPALLAFVEFTNGGRKLPEVVAARMEIERHVKSVQIMPSPLTSIMHYRHHCLTTPTAQIRGLLTAMAKKAQQAAFESLAPHRDGSLIRAVRLAFAGQQFLSGRSLHPRLLRLYLRTLWLRACPNSMSHWARFGCLCPGSVFLRRPGSNSLPYVSTSASPQHCWSCRACRTGRDRGRRASPPSLRRLCQAACTGWRCWYLNSKSASLCTLKAQGYQHAFCFRIYWPFLSQGSCNWYIVSNSKKKIYI